MFHKVIIIHCGKRYDYMFSLYGIIISVYHNVERHTQKRYSQIYPYTFSLSASVSAATHSTGPLFCLFLLCLYSFTSISASSAKEKRKKKEKKKVLLLCSPTSPHQKLVKMFSSLFSSFGIVIYINIGLKWIDLCGYFFCN